MMESIAQQAAKHAREVFSDDRQAQTAISYMEQLVYAALRNVEYDLTDPVTVHANMLRGTIAKPTVEQIVHLYGVDALAKALAPVIVREAGIEPVAAPRRYMGQIMAECDCSRQGECEAAQKCLAVAAPDPAAIREAALKEASEVCAGIRQRIANGPMPEGARFDYEQAILALIEKGTAK